MSRAIRRHHRERLKARTRKILSSRLHSIFNPGWSKDLKYRVNIRWNNMCMCSCYMCGNPRHAFGRKERTMQEKKHFDRYFADLEELSLDP